MTQTISPLKQKIPSSTLLAWRPSENTILLMLAVAVGIATAIGVWLFREGIDFFQRVFREGLLNQFFSNWHGWGIIAVLILAGLIVGSLMARFIGEERHHGVAGVMESSAFAGGRLRYRRMPLKATLAAFTLGAGASGGPEDPSVQIGANLGSMVGQWLRLSDDRVRLLVAAGAAGGIAAAFRAPIAGVFFALEVVLGDFSTGSFGVVVLTAVISAVATQAIEAQNIIFSTSQITMPELGMSNYALGGIQEIPLYILLGIAIAPIAALFIRLLYWQQDFWHHLHLPTPLKTALAGAVIGAIAVFVPQVMGTSRDTINTLLNQNGGNFDLTFLLILVVAKMFATTITLGGGFLGGMFAPSLLVGAAVGRGYGMILMSIFPGHISADPSAFAIAGMAAALTGVIRSPITAVILMFEITNDYNLILPIMLTTAVCLIVVERLAPDGIYHLGLARKGIRLARGRDIDLMQTILVKDAMTKKVSSIAASATLVELQTAFDKYRTHGLVVTDPNGLLFGVVTFQDLTRILEEGTTSGLTVKDICTQDVVTVTPELPISVALSRLTGRDLGRLPVVAEDNPRQILGILRRRDIIQAYDLATQRKLQAMQEFRNIRLATYSEARVIELRINPGSEVDQHTIRDIKWPEGSLVATIRRRHQVIVPRGDTVLQAGDVLTIVTTAEQAPQLNVMVGTKTLPTPEGVSVSS